MDVSFFNNLRFRENPLLRVNENCVDLDLGEICSSNCADRTVACLSYCNPDDVSCQNSCVRQGFDCIDGCPCHTDCFEGCEGCAAEICSVCAEPGENPDYNRCLNEVELDLYQCLDRCSGDSACVNQCTLQFLEDFENCPCESGCPNGCPCPNYECGDVNPTLPPQELGSVLILDRNYNHLPALANFNSFNEDINVSFYNNGPDNLEYNFYDGCSVVYRGKNYLFGGWYENEDGSKAPGPHILNECDIEKVGGETFFFDCYSGAVGFLPTDDDPEAYIMLYDGKHKVQTYDGSKVWDNSLPEPKVSHTGTGGHIPVYEGYPILISGYNEDTGIGTSAVERYNKYYGWSIREGIEFPEQYIQEYTSVWGDFGVIVFPGFPGESSKIWRLYEDQWTNMGTVPWDGPRRFARAVLFPNNEVMILGGSGSQNFHKFYFNDGLTIRVWETLNYLPAIANYDDPHAILVPNGHCTV